MSKILDALAKKNGGTLEPLHETAAVLAYEAGRVLENAMYAFWDEKKGVDEIKSTRMRIAFLQTELMDVIAQSVVICERQGWNFEEMKELGIEKMMERFTGKEKKY